MTVVLGNFLNDDSDSNRDPRVELSPRIDLRAFGFDAFLAVVDMRHVHIAEVQRDEKDRAVAKMVESWLPDIAGVATLALRSTGEYVILDGQQRRAALLKQGKYAMPAIVLTDLTHETEEVLSAMYREGDDVLHEGKVFELINTSRTRLNEWEIQKAALMAGDELALRVHQVLAQTGWTLLPVWNRENSPPRHIGGPATFRGLIKLGPHRKTGVDGATAVKFALGTFNTVWPDWRGIGDVYLMKAIALIYQENANVLDIDRLHSVLAKLGPRQIADLGKKWYAKNGGEGYRKGLQCAIIEEYNKRLRENNRLPFPGK